MRIVMHNVCCLWSCLSRICIFGIPDDSVSDWLVRVVEVFSGLDEDYEFSAQPSSEPVRGHVNELLRRVDTTRYLKQTVEIALNLEEIYILNGLGINIYIQLIDFSTLNAKRATFASLYRGCLTFPRARLTSLSFNNRGCFEVERDIEELIEILDDCDVRIPKLFIYVSNDELGDDTWANLILSAFRLTGDRKGKLDALTVKFDAEYAQKVETLFSALPHAKSVHTIQVIPPDFSPDGRSWNRHGWTWLSYALYHPQSKYSSWKNLDLSWSDISEDWAASLTSTGRSKDEFVKLTVGGSKTQVASTQLVSVMLRADAECHYSRSLDDDEDELLFTSSK